jgi:transcriptional regulator with XRE-family HTH domain
MEFGGLLRGWRQRRRMSQFDLALEANVSARHLSFVETGRARPSREMVLMLAEHLDVPLRERNVLLVAAGFAPVFAERSLDDPQLFAARRAVDLILDGHAPFPALAIDRHWTLVAANRTVNALIGDAAPALLVPPVNVVRLSLHPDGLAPRIVNLTEWAAHLVARLRREIAISGDAVLSALLDEVTDYPTPKTAAAAEPASSPLGGIAIPFRLRTDAGILSFISTTTVFGTPADITLSELALETFFPADPFTAKALHDLPPPH